MQAPQGKSERSERLTEERSESRESSVRPLSSHPAWIVPATIAGGCAGNLSSAAVLATSVHGLCRRPLPVGWAGDLSYPNTPLQIRDLASQTVRAEIPNPGSARERLRTSCEGSIYDYAEKGDEPAADVTSRLSADLKFGRIGIREVYAATEKAMQDAPDEDGRDSVVEFQRQLAWREFYAHGGTCSVRGRERRMTYRIHFKNSIQYVRW